TRWSTASCERSRPEATRRPATRSEFRIDACAAKLPSIERRVVRTDSVVADAGRREHHAGRTDDGRGDGRLRLLARDGRRLDAELSRRRDTAGGAVPAGAPAVVPLHPAHRRREAVLRDG